MKFSDYQIAHEIKKNLEKLNFKRPTDIQYKSITPILNGEDVLAIAQTGTGKTAAFAIPIIDFIKKTKKISQGEVRCLIMVPTHELALQIKEVFGQLGNNTGVKTFCIFGGVEQQAQIDRLANGVDILIATPGRMFDLVSQGHLNLRKVEILVLDEADHMLDLGFIKDIKDLLKLIPKKRQTLFFSATIDKKIKKLAYSLVNNAIRIEISPKDPVSKNVEHSVTFISMDEKRFYLERLIKDNSESKILVFVRTKIRAERIAKAMERVNVVADTMHSDKGQADRIKTMELFRTGEQKILIATDINARGIDIPNVDFVVNYDLPDQAENYVHRVGRTGRGRLKGIAISFCSEEEKIKLEEIENFMGKTITIIQISKNIRDEIKNLAIDETEDWRSLMQQAEAPYMGKIRKKKKRKN